jgi:hypothetical protein
LTAKQRRSTDFETWWQRWVGTIAFLLLIFLTALGFFYIQHFANQTHDSLCTLRGNLETQVQNTQNFLEDPSIAPSFDDPKTLALIDAQLQQQQAALDALSGLSC